MNVRLRHVFHLESAHRLPRLPADHKCHRLHGHSYRVEIAVRGPVDPEMGWLVDFDVLLDAWRPLHDQLDHRYLNEVEGLANPTSENLARWIWERLKLRLPGLSRVTINETCETACDYEGD
jgi:6-pyruvoyltetrahydropterin/6-carboxytetrahydropterin synthase